MGDEPLNVKDPDEPLLKDEAINRKKSRLRPNPEASANFFSRISFFFMTNIFRIGYRKSLEVEDMYEPLPQHDSETACRKLTTAWEYEQKLASEQKRDASLLKAVIRTYWKQVAQLGILLFLEEFIHLLQPLFMGRLIRFFRHDSSLTTNEALFSAAGVAISAAVVAMIHHPYFYGLQKIGMELKIAASGMMVNKGIRLSSAALQKATVGHMINILSTDVTKFDTGFLFFHYIWVSPLLLLGYSYFLWQEIGPSLFAGFGGLIVLIPIQGYFSRQMGACRREISVRTDKRISVMNEILNGIRVIKMYAWEGAFAQVIGQLRSREMEKVRANAAFQSLVMGLFWSSGKLVVLFSAVCYVFTGNILTAERIFVSTALFNSCRLPITLFLPFSIQFFFEARVSIRRIQAFLELEDFSRVSITNSKPKTKKTKSINDKAEEETPLTNADEDVPESKHCDINIKSGEDRNGAHITLNNFSSSWTTAEESGEDVVAVRNVDLSASKGQLVAVVGPVGAGKSSLLYTLLGEARGVNGTLSMSGRIAYCSQDSWIFSGTVRDNILFDQSFDEARYRKAIDYSALSNDIAQLPHGDATTVGDRGTSLSGGQKARIALARALYSDGDIYLLDDPLSAVDAAVGRFLFDKCICHVLKDKIRILVTHQVQFLDKADIVLLMRNGEVIASGPPSQLKKSHAKEFEALIHETEETYARRISESGTPRRTLSETESEEHQSLQRALSVTSDKEEHVFNGKADYVAPVEEEEKGDGAVSWAIYWHYIRAMCGNPWIVAPLTVMVLAVQLIFNITDWWLNKWANASETIYASVLNGSTSVEITGEETVPLSFLGYVLNLTLSEYMYTFAVLTFVLIIGSVIRCVWFRMAQIVASSLLHNRMFDAIVKAKIIFFDKNPIGRILNRFSKDVGTMDDQLSFVFFEFMMGALNVFGLVAVILFINPIVFLPTLPLLILFVFLRIVYLSTSRDVKRLEATTRSPLYSHISAVMHGLVTVRAFSKQNQAMLRYHEVQNINSSGFGLTVSTSRWFAVCTDWLVAFFVTAVSFFCIYTHTVMTSGEVALMLVYAVQLTGFFSWIMRQSAELQNGMVSVERVVNYTQLEPELTSDKTVPDEWPTAGHLQMNNVYLKYDETSDYVLKRISLDIKPKEKIGIVGRTGAGKSSLLRALFRLTVPCEGNILIDTIDCANVPLQRLRKSISIIPQEPVLFIGSLRRNLDPFDEYSDEAVWDALEQVELKSVVVELQGGLQASMQEGGVNFSVGQRQLICLARALLRHARILVIDEATANVDPQTDALIQKTIRMRFADSTVLTIAHRLNTIMDSTRVLVLKDGEVAEIATAHELLQKPESLLSSLVEETGSANAALLRKIAKQAYDHIHQEN
ncbi:unnamed protein product [Auanema sp. JU1783]|nr:unnamed protein product [Auanema sp. JU1783]